MVYKIIYDMESNYNNDIQVEKFEIHLVHIEEHMKSIKETINNLKIEKKESHKDFETRIRKMEDWKIQFVAKFTVYSALALFIGSFLSQLFINLIEKII